MTNLLTLTPAEFCAVTKACDDGRKFALRHATMADVWDNCPRPDWLLWIADRLDQMPDDKTLRLFAVWCARHTPLGDGRVTGDLIRDPRSLAALEVAERYANGHASVAELIAAYANAAPAAYADATYAARAARTTRAAAADAATYAATYAACDAAYANAAYANAAYAYAADAAQADQYRRMVPNPFGP